MGALSPGDTSTRNNSGVAWHRGRRWVATLNRILHSTKTRSGTKLSSETNLGPPNLLHPERKNLDGFHFAYHLSTLAAVSALLILWKHLKLSCPPVPP